jgi:hypothetical protein
MPPRRRNKASSARTAAIQAVRKRNPEMETQEHNNNMMNNNMNINMNMNNSMNIHNDDIPDMDDLEQERDHDEVEGCLHCHTVITTAGSTAAFAGAAASASGAAVCEIQVRCDECQSYICQGCHWCHEFQANHEIRVCDRCDAFYCRNCDEMDQCDDCGEVVCASCSTLLSCKFCGGGLCEECATACGR